MNSNANGSLVVGVGEGEYYLANNLEIIRSFTNKVFLIQGNEYVKIMEDKINIFTSEGKKKNKIIIMELDK